MYRQGWCKLLLRNACMVNLGFNDHVHVIEDEREGLIDLISEEQDSGNGDIASEMNSQSLEGSDVQMESGGVLRPMGTLIGPQAGAVVEEMTGSRPRLAEEDVYSWDD